MPDFRGAADTYANKGNIAVPGSPRTLLLGEDKDYVGTRAASDGALSGFGRRLGHADNKDANGHVGITAKTQLRGMCADAVVPASGTIRVTGKVGYATGSALTTLVGLSINTENLVTTFDAGFAAKPTIAGGVVNPPAMDVTIEGLVPGTIFFASLAGEAVGGGSAIFATPFSLDIYEVVT